MVYERLSNYFISQHPCELLTTFQADHQYLFKWIISHNQVHNRPLSKRYINGFPKGLSLAIQIVYQPPSKRIITYFPSESSTSIQVDYQPPSRDNRPLIKWFMNNYPNSLSPTIHVNY